MVCTAAMGNTQFLKKLGLPYNSAIPLLRIYPKEKLRDSSRYVWTSVYNNIENAQW